MTIFATILWLKCDYRRLFEQYRTRNAPDAASQLTDGVTALQPDLCYVLKRAGGSQMYPTPIRSERYADAAMHAIGLTGAMTGSALLLIQPGGHRLALTIYACALIFTFVASAIYHLAPWHEMRDMFHRFDHAGIYLKIAGTYTPLVVMVGSTFAYIVLAVVWAVAVLGAVMVFHWQKPSRFGPGLYVGLGWLSVLLIWSLWSVLPLSSMVLIAVGGLLYTAGVPFFASKRAYTTAVWHGFVVGASACLWSAILIGSTALA